MTWTKKKKIENWIEQKNYKNLNCFFCWLRTCRWRRGSMGRRSIKRSLRLKKADTWWEPVDHRPSSSSSASCRRSPARRLPTPPPSVRPEAKAPDSTPPSVSADQVPVIFIISFQYFLIEFQSFYNFYKKINSFFLIQLNSS